VSNNLARLVTDSAARFPERPALRLDDTVVTYEMLGDGASHVAGLLKDRGLQPGDRVGIMLPNVPYFAVVYYGVLRAGGVVVPMNVLLKPREVRFYLSDSGAKHLFAWHEFADPAHQGAKEAGAETIVVKPGEFEQLLAGAPSAPEDAERDPSDTAVILYTSGTTGTPKGAELTHANVLENCRHGGTELVRVTEQDVLLGALPLFHAFGQTCCMNNAIGAGACLTMIPRFDPAKALEIIERDKVTLFEGVPTMYHAMLNHPDRDRSDVSSLRTCVSGGSAMPVEVMRGFEEAFGCVVLEGYGLSETSPVASFNHLDREHKPGSIGTPIKGVEMKVVDENDDELPTGEVGEIVIRGHNVMKGYWDRPDATAEVIRDGWLHTGDMARIDEDGYFFIVDRKKDMIIRGATTCIRARSRRCSTSIRPCSRRRCSESPTLGWVRRSVRPWS
jgi:long-chain acyl-CoA synthetase